jgi:hypothetical protein
MIVPSGDAEVSRRLLQLLGRAAGPPGVAAYLCGALWELAAAPTAAAQLIEAGKLAAVLSRAGVVLLGQVTQVVSQQQLSRVKLAYQVGT